MTVSLQPPEDKPPRQVAEEAPVEEVSDSKKPEEVKEEHAPVSNGETFASDNQTDKTETEVVAGLGESAPSKPAEVLPESSDVISEEVSDISTDDSSPEPPETESLAEKEQATGSPLDPLVEPSLPSENRAIVSSNSTLADKSYPKPIAEVSDTPFTDVGTGIPESQAINEIAKLMESPVGDSADETSKDTVKNTTAKQNLEIPSSFLDRYGSLKLLGESDLRDSVVIQPFSEQRSNELTLANKYLDRMNRQVLAHWVNPYQGGRLYAGIIRVKISLNGYLEDVRVYRSSGLPYLDESVIKAIKTVKRFEVPDDEIIVARYYSRMSFHYTSIKGETELMPFQKEIANKEDS